MTLLVSNYASGKWLIQDLIPIAAIGSDYGFWETPFQWPIRHVPVRKQA
jgi:hypothetical protein